MKRLPIPAALLRGAACLAALAFVLPAAVFAADHSDHNGWTEIKSTDNTLEQEKYWLSGDVTITGSIHFQTASQQIFCLAGHSLTVSPKNNNMVFNITRPLTVENCGSVGSISVSGIPISVYNSLTLTENVTVNGDIDVAIGGSSEGLTTGSLTVGSGSTVNGTITVESGAAATVKSGGTANYITVESGGEANIYGTVTGKITVKDGGTLNIHDGAEVSGGVDTSGTTSITGDTTVINHGITVNGGTCTITDGKIQNFFKNGNGGGVYVADGGTCTIQGATEITGNSAIGGNGGGVYVAGGSCIIQGSAKITGNTARASSQGNGGCGGGVYVAGGSCTIGDAVQITDNTAGDNSIYGGDGGGVYVADGGECIVNGINATVSNNHADGDGGGVYVEEGGSFSFSSDATNNTAGGNGGGIYLAESAVDNSARYNMDGADISGNNALNGGGIYAGENVVINMASGSIYSNNAIGDGGGVYLSSGAELYTYAQIKDNVAGGDGGGIRATDGCIIYLNKNDSFRSAVSGNKDKAGSNPNGMYVNGSDWEIAVNGSFIYNDLYLSAWDGRRGTVNIDAKGITGCIISGTIQAYYVDVTMKGGTVSSNSVNLINTKWENAGGYCSISGFKLDGESLVWISGGYFDSTTSLDEESQRYISVNPGYKMIAVDENTVGTEFKEDFPYAVYPQEDENVTVTVNENITYDGQPVEPGTDFTLKPDGTTLLESSYKAQDAGDDAYQEGLPTNAGGYTIQAKCLNKDSKWYAEVTFMLTIDKADPQPAPVTGLTGLHGHVLSEVSLPEGWAWKVEGTTAITMTDAGEQEFTAVFTPTDTDNYNTVNVPLTVTVEHDWGDWVPNGNDTHTGTCSYESCTETKTANCSGGAASYFEKAVCDICGGEYGALLQDTTAPEGVISIRENEWKSLLSSITFKLFFKETQTVTITADDDSYAAAGYTDDKAAVVEWALYRGENPPTTVTALEKEGLAFTDYTAPFSIEPDDKLVVYAKITDHAGNITYISSDGLVLDGTAPAVTGVEEGGVYYVTRQVTVTDGNLDSVTLNGQTVQSPFTLEGNLEKTYVITATDKAGNETTVTVTMKPIAALEEAVKDRTADNIAFEDEAALNAALAAAKGVDLTWATQAEQEELAALVTRLEGLATVLAEAKAVDQAVAALPEAVEPDDTEAEEDILAAKAQFDALTEHQRQLIPEAAAKLEKLLADLKDYRLVQGDGSSWRRGSGKDMTFTANGPLSKLTAVLVDGRTVDEANYTAVSGSTIITFKRAWLETLATGEHTLTVQYPDGAATGSFEVLKSLPWADEPAATPAPAAAAGVPATGEDGPMLWAGLLVVSAAALAVVWGVGKRSGKK